MISNRIEMWGMIYLLTEAKTIPKKTQARYSEGVTPVIFLNAVLNDDLEW